MKSAMLLLMLSGVVAASPSVVAQEEWPRTITASDSSIIRIYSPQPDSLRDNFLKYRSAFSVTRKGDSLPRFGSFLALAGIETERNNRRIHLLDDTVLYMSYSARLSTGEMNDLKATLERGIPRAGRDISLDGLLSTLDRNVDGAYVSKELTNNLPRIIVVTRPTILVLIDGIPRIKRNSDWDLNVVANTPYTIIESSDGWFYLYGGRNWYIAPSPAGPFNYTGYFAPDMRIVQLSINQLNKKWGAHKDTLPEDTGNPEDVVVATAPAELIQTKGTPVFASIDGTRLQYATNTNNDLFLDNLSGRYYVLLSGRWYRSVELTKQWQFVPADSLPADFRKIPEGSPKDNVLSSVPGTEAAREAVMDACIPQTAQIDRRMAVTTVIYDGNPKFEDIPGTHLQYALNSPTTVLLYRHKFYAVDKGVWFCAEFPRGPWTLSTERPDEVDLIPPDCPVYSCKFVYIYAVTPDYIYTGYTAGYLNSFISGSTLVYGTGYYYPSWMDNVCYPHPWTWGFNMWYNPWAGWCLGHYFGLDWFNTGTAWGLGYWGGGWWGPSQYRPPYVWHHANERGLYTAIANQPSPDSIYTDSQGIIYRKRQQGGWLQLEGSDWQPLGNDRSDTVQQLNRRAYLIERGKMRLRSFQQGKSADKRPF